MQSRKEPLVENCYYHIFSRSIAGFVIFNNPDEYLRMFEILELYRYTNFNHKYCKFIGLDLKTQETIKENLKKDNDLLVEIVAYCLMPTHFHLILKQVGKDGISKYVSKVLNSYSRSFNIKHRRSGPLWDGRFKSLLVNKDEQLLHLTRYIHLNPTSAKLVKNPQDWLYSSYMEYIDDNFENKLCVFDGLFDFTPKEYKKFVLDRKSYQQELSKIKHLLIDNYTG